MLILFAFEGQAQKPVVSFTANKTAGCSPLTVVFTNNTSGSGPINYIWRFGNGNISTLGTASVSATYVLPGTYTVSLTATNSSGTDSLRRIAYITVYANPIADFTVAPPSGCVPLNTTFSDASTKGTGNLTTWLWDFGDGSSSNQASPNKVYTSTGSYNVTMIVTDQFGCEGRITKNNLIITTPAHTVNFTGAPLAKCRPDLTTNFSSTVSPASSYSYLWEFGDGNTSTLASPSHTYTARGARNVTLTVTNTVSGCTVKNQKAKYVFIPDLEADFNINATAGCAPVVVNFINNSIPDSSIYTYTWSGPNGYFSNAKNPPPANVFTSGTYTYRLISRWPAGGCADTVSKSITVNVLPKPVASFSADRTRFCVQPFTVNYNNLSFGAASYNWLFSPSGTSTETNPVRNYLNFGRYTTTLIATSIDGCKDTLKVVDYIQSYPAGFMIRKLGPTSGCAPLSTSFEAVDTSRSPLSIWKWYLGNGDSAVGSIVNYTYHTPGKYILTVKGSNPDGCVAIRVDTVFIGSPISTDFIITPASGCYSTYSGKLQMVPPFNKTSRDTVIWKLYREGALINTYFDTTPTISKPGLGEFDVELIVSINGCRTYLRKNNILEILGPKADFEVNKIRCSTNVFQFTNTSLEANKIMWKFPDSTISYNRDTTLTFDFTGSHEVVLYAFDTITGCIDTIKKNIDIPRKPAIQFNLSDTIGCAPFRFTVSDSSLADAPILFQFWRFTITDGQSKNTRVSQFTTNLQGYSSVTLIVTDSAGCVYTHKKDSAIYVYKGLAQVTATPPIGCAPLLITARDSSVTENNVLTYTYRWGNGDSLVTASNQVNYTYQNPNINQKNGFNLTLSITDNKGCKFGSPPVKIVPIKPVANFAISKFKRCGIDSFRFDAVNNTSIGWLPKFNWKLGNGSFATGPNIVQLFAGDTTYTVTLIVSDTMGCADSLSKPYTINTKPPVSKFDATPKKLDCYKPAKVIKFLDSTVAGGSGIKSYQWTFGDNTTSTLKNPDKIYAKPGVYAVSLEVTDSVNCKNKLTMPDFVVVGGPYGSHSYTPKKGCMPLEVDFTSSSPNAMLIVWDHADGIVDTLRTHQHNYLYSQPGVYYPRVTLIDSSGTCDFGLDAIDSIVVHPLPKVDFTASDTLICKNTTILFTNTTPFHPTPIKEWKWTFAGTDSIFMFGPISKMFPSAGKFSVALKATDTLGCIGIITRDSMVSVYDDTIPPAVPYILRATVEDNELVLMQNLANKESDFKEYVIHYNFMNGFPNSAKVITQINDTNFKESGLNTLENTYSYKMYAMDVCMNRSTFSQTHTTVELKANAIGNAVHLKWTPYKGWDSIKHYEVWKNDPELGNDFHKIAETPADSLNYIDTNIVCFKPYNYRIMAVESGGQSQISWSDTSSATPIFIPLVPGTKNIRATVVDNKYVRVEWRSRGYKLPFKYAIYRSVGDDEPLFYKFIAATDTVLLDMDVDVHKYSYNYVTYLIDSCGGISPVSNLAKSILLKLEMEGNDILKHDPVLTWNAYSNWFSGVDYYNVEFFYDSLDDFSLVAKTPPDQLIAKHRYVNLQQQDYCYKVTAFQKDSNDIFSESNITCIETAPRLYAPNVFTINGDNLNDTYRLGGLFIDQFELRIYNRWGILMFESFDLFQGWDGTFNGKPCPVDVYFYTAKGVGRRGQTTEISGNITLLR